MAKQSYDIKTTGSPVFAMLDSVTQCIEYSFSLSVLAPIIHFNDTARSAWHIIKVITMKVTTSLTILGGAATAVAQSAPTVKLQNGTVNGIKCSGTDVNSFLGIPFAQAPINTLRFAPPQPYNQTYGSLDATKPPPACIQFNAAFSESGAQSEDWYICLQRKKI